MIKLQPIIINNRRYLFSTKLNNKNTQYYVYELRHSDMDFTKPVSIEPWVLCNRYGFLYTKRQLKFYGKDFIKIISFKFCSQKDILKHNNKKIYNKRRYK